MCPQSSSLQSEKTKADVKSVGADVRRQLAGAGQAVSETAHKAGVKLGVAEPTAGENIGHGVEKLVDSISGKHDPTL